MSERQDEDEDIAWLGWLRRNSRPLFLPLLMLSLVIAASALVQAAVGEIAYLFLIAFSWLALLAIAALAFNRRALWFLIGAPFALGPAILLIAFVYMY